MARIAQIRPGLAGIDAAIRQFAGVAGNLETRVQMIAVAIIEHAAGPGNGDMSRALTLVKTMKRFRSLNTAFIIGFFRHFASTNINLRANDGAGKVSLMSKDAKGYRGFDVDGARHNKWNEAVDGEGNRAPWYAGPTPAEFEPETVGSLALDMRRFVKRTQDKLKATVKVGDRDVEKVRLTEGETEQVNAALKAIEGIANTLARHEEIRELTEALAEKQGAAENDTGEAILELATQEKAVA